MPNMEVLVVYVVDKCTVTVQLLFTVCVCPVNGFFTFCSYRRGNDLYTPYVL